MKSGSNYLRKPKTDVDRALKNMEKSKRRRQIEAERKKFRRNQQPKGPRRKSWGIEDADEADLTAFERIMPRDEGERRRMLEQAAQARNGGAQVDEQAEDGAPSRKPGASPNGADTVVRAGLVVEFGSGLCRVDIGGEAEGEVVLCSLRGALAEQESGFTNPVAVGDRVTVRLDGAGGGVVEEVLPRRSLLARPDVFNTHLRQILVANADQLLIVASWREPALWLELIDRYLIAAARGDLPALLCINKLDLATGLGEVQETLAPYTALGIPCLLTSAETGEGIAELRARLQGRTTVLAGLSGVGKSSLLQAIRPELNLRTGAVSDRRHEGRHTTTQAVLVQLGESTNVVDTPGIREFGLAGLGRSELSGFFPEIAAAAEGCRFRNCAHIDEPQCAVRAAVRRGRIAQSRYHSYRQIYAELA